MNKTINQDPGIWAPADPAVIPDDDPMWHGAPSWAAFQSKRDRETAEAADAAIADFLRDSQPYEGRGTGDPS